MNSENRLIAFLSGMLVSMLKLWIALGDKLRKPPKKKESSSTLLGELVVRQVSSC